MHNPNAVTLIELIAVLIILSTLAVIAVPNYQRTIEQARDKEAIACLRLIQAGERIYRSEFNHFFPTPSDPSQPTADINTVLKLSLTTQNWDYEVAERGSDNFRVKATRRNPPPNFAREWIINSYNCNAIFGASCDPLVSCPSDSNNDLGCFP